MVTSSSVAGTTSTSLAPTTTKEEGAVDNNINKPVNNIYETFELKTDSDKKNAPTAQGRVYSTQYAQQPGGLKVEEMIFGVKMAHLSCTDDSEERLKKSGANTIVALEEIVGKDDAHLPLTTLLKKHFDLTLDCWIDESGLRKGRPVDTQGFIASNEDTIVLSFRFSTSIMDWLTNLSMTTSEWEPDRDEVIGHAGWCSSCDGLFTKYFTKRGKPRVHTGFYNNFIYTIPMIRKHILSKLLPSSDNTIKPKKVFICGCSLGAAIATMAFCFVLQEMQATLENPNAPAHKLILVTAGSPRVCDERMRQVVMERMQKLRSLDRAVICRLVYNHDLVPHIPFNVTGFHHLDKLVYIPLEGEPVFINPKLEKSFKSLDEIKEVYHRFVNATSNATITSTTKDDANKEADSGKTPFELECEKTPEPIKDHMPYWYLTFLQKLKAKVDAGQV